ncbi:phosphorybosylanthranilate isomerase [Haladaptatus sp. R4]|uniref:BtpA/SgcQ family protein n=1 Tax=Haladaptatus sp. R4 TaxID=1679489 RepID=UPI0007B45D64|nr:BtpA/SgcQ family protein [Haladaptatus sp. R4]KZN24755.1 phosphorybosylanthranilate isomerase [Haladaptatus sp. R4]
MVIFDTDAIVGMVHLPALPGAPGFDGNFDALRTRALTDAHALESGGVDAIMVENFGDSPFHPNDVPKHVVASMTRVVTELRQATECPLGVNVLRNDAEAALSIATAADAQFIRVNVHTGARLTDQGIIEGSAHETIRLRDELDSDVKVLADVDVKHSAALAERPVSELVDETLGRGRADGIVVSGVGTGHEVDTEMLEAVVACRDGIGSDAPVLLGSGTTAENVRDLLNIADGAIVGTALKEGGETTNRVDEERVRGLVEGL